MDEVGREQLGLADQPVPMLNQVEAEKEVDLLRVLLVISPLIRSRISLDLNRRRCLVGRAKAVSPSGRFSSIYSARIGPVVR